MIQQRPPLRKIAEAYFEIAKKTLVKDGHHTHIVILISDRTVVPFPLGDIKQSDTHKAFEEVADRASSMNAYAVVAISEAWMAGYDESQPNRSASDSPTRSESLFLSAISDTGDEFYISAPFEKRNGAVVIGPTIQRDAGSIASPVFEPLRKMWKLKRHKN